MSFNHLAVREIERTIFTTPSTNGWSQDSIQKTNVKQREQPICGMQKGGDALVIIDPIVRILVTTILSLVTSMLLYIGYLLW